MPIHIYTITQIIVTTGIFIITLTKAGPAFPIIIIALVPVRLLLMNKLWSRDVLRYVDAWACRDGTPENDEDRRKAGVEVELQVRSGSTSELDVERGRVGDMPEPMMTRRLSQDDKKE